MANLQLYEPFRDIFNLSDEFGRLFWGPTRRTRELELESKGVFVPSIDVSEDKDAMTIRAELPGLKKEDVKIKVHEGVLTLSGEKKFEEEQKKENFYRIERSYGSFARSFTLPNTVDSEKINASIKEGVLTLRIPKKPEAKEKVIQVEVE